MVRKRDSLRLASQLPARPKAFTSPARSRLFERTLAPLSGDARAHGNGSFDRSRVLRKHTNARRVSSLKKEKERREGEVGEGESGAAGRGSPFLRT